MNPELKRFHLCRTALHLFSEKGYDEVSMDEIAKKALVSKEDLFTLFGNKQDIVLFLYQSINSDWQLAVNEMTSNKLADRFEEALIHKITLIEPYAQVLGNMIGMLFKNSNISVGSPRTSHIRAMGLQTMQSIIDGSNNSKSLHKKIPHLSSLLYSMHWAVLFLHLQTNNTQKTVASIQKMAKMLNQVNHLSFFLNLFPFVNDLGTWAHDVVNPGKTVNDSLNREILKIIFNFRKTNSSDKECRDNSCETCMQIHEFKVNYFTHQNKPLHFILPAFPAKSPNPQKVLGVLPDLGEQIALSTLDDICKEIKSIYKPGATITICSDGRIFSELVGVTHEDVTHYVNGIKSLINQLNLHYISIVNLEDLMDGDSFDAMKNTVIETYAEPLDDLKAKIKTVPESKNLFNGIHRFISDDRLAMNSGKSATKIKEESKDIAYKVIQYSNAWTRFLTYYYPDAIRLSIHPYPSHSDKIGIQLTRASDNWLTPWHGVIVLQADGYVLMKKNEAEKQGARLIEKFGVPYYYSLVAE